MSCRAACCSVIGTPDEEDIDAIESEKARRYIASLPFKPPIPHERIFPNANPEAISLLKQMLVYVSAPNQPAAPRTRMPRAARTHGGSTRRATLAQASGSLRDSVAAFVRPRHRFNPYKRCTVEQSLAHSYLASLHDPSDEPLAHAEVGLLPVLACARPCPSVPSRRHARRPAQPPTHSMWRVLQFSFDFERMPLTKQALRELLTAEMLAYHPEFASEAAQQQQMGAPGMPPGDDAMMQ
jgi:hypothetical protein